jgi:hypothetical protein
MKTTIFASITALLAAAGAAAAGEPMVLTNTQLDRVTAGSHDNCSCWIRIIDISNSRATLSGSKLIANGVTTVEINWGGKYIISQVTHTATRSGNADR